MIYFINLKNYEDMYTTKNLYKMYSVDKYHILLTQNIIFRLRKIFADDFLYCYPKIFLKYIFHYLNSIIHWEDSFHHSQSSV